MSVALAWLKKNWYWVVLPVGILYLILRIFRLIKPGQHTTVIQGGKPTSTADVALHGNQTAAKIDQAEAATSADIKKIEEWHKATLDKLSDAQRIKYEDLKKKGAQATTEWLLKVGKGES